VTDGKPYLEGRGAVPQDMPIRFPGRVGDTAFAQSRRLSSRATLACGWRYAAAWPFSTELAVVPETPASRAMLIVVIVNS
jgi:hypothetical protein